MKSQIEVGSLVEYMNHRDIFLDVGVGVVMKMYNHNPFDILVLMVDGKFLLDIPERFMLL